MVIALIMVGVKSTLLAIPALTQAADPENLSFFDLFWASFTKILSLGGEPTWADRIVAVMYWVTTTALTASVIGYVVGAIQRTFARLRKGRSPIVDSNHTLILGWSSRIFPILQELAIANQNVRKPVVVIFAPHDREFMEDEIESRTEDLGKLKIVTRSGEPSNPIDLKRTNISNAKSVIILDADETGDANVVSTVLAVKAVNSNPNLRIVAELDDRDTAEAISVATQGQVLSIRSHEVIARVTAQASRQPGLSTVILDLLDFSGDEIYFSEIPALEGKTYADALLAFSEASVIGLLDANGTAMVNPAQNFKIKEGMQVIGSASASTTDRGVFSQAARPDEPGYQKGHPHPSQRQRKTLPQIRALDAAQINAHRKIEKVRVGGPEQESVQSIRKDVQRKEVATGQELEGELDEDEGADIEHPKRQQRDSVGDEKLQKPRHQHRQ